MYEYSMMEELNLANIDPYFWSLAKQEAEMLDPQHCILKRHACESADDYGIDALFGVYQRKTV
ncbi:uncharacterized protein ColSpa_03127 [Colletotrichum spaethianum]|uniref:Uncharacterized protein n=1 Tax=Colletotrichum spaethianum TaxID=700344 RepID=A0AA37L6Z9_9PEZI|nr:uncharacterized protein ColSpa_03127 [Colletotrichum spaethianum]GKT42946.1 hypothetical protein ColSpa_03127 [Colletotrichum spaethianum]